ncbi:hypothetical protein [Gracilibacillus sp. YIM 98692]|uniref:hypothetical protein n=1 Tax=Gracilibacillus sp. YIM 98692 TaxID=2663532 RepID=UPI0013D72213|nr:hypothetical protein [Gracilibacillus sp. YIM 98692]
MADYTGMKLTDNGRGLQAKAEAGETLTFNKVKIGDGELVDGDSYETRNDLVNPLLDLNISVVQAEEDGTCLIRSNMTNEGVNEGFYVKEVGIFAQDPDIGEILYAFSTAVVTDYLPPEGGATVVNNQFDTMVVIGNADSITADISNTGFVTQDDFDDHKNEFDAHKSDDTNPHNVTASQAGAYTKSEVDSITTDLEIFSMWGGL